MAFDFSLATVLRVRGIAEEREERLLLRLLQELASTAQKLDDLDSALANANAARHAQARQPTDGLRLQSEYAEIQQLRALRQETQQQLAKLEQLKRIQMQAYTSARQSREALADMRHDQRTAYDVAASRREQSTIDDIFAANSALRRSFSTR